MTIRSYQPSDQHSVWELHHLALEASGAHLGEGTWDEDLKHIPEVYLQKKGSFLVGLLGEQVMAMGALKSTDSIRAEIKRMRVHPDFQHRGYGTAILEALEIEARSLGYEILHLDTTTLQISAQNFYNKHGYQITGTGVVGPFHTLLYEKRLMMESHL